VLEAFFRCVGPDRAEVRNGRLGEGGEGGREMHGWVGGLVGQEWRNGWHDTNLRKGPCVMDSRRGLDRPGLDWTGLDWTE
jgi:hypothetical protein